VCVCVCVCILTGFRITDNYYIGLHKYVQHKSFIQECHTHTLSYLIENNDFFCKLQYTVLYKRTRVYFAKSSAILNGYEK